MYRKPEPQDRGIARLCLTNKAEDPSLHLRTQLVYERASSQERKTKGKIFEEEGSRITNSTSSLNSQCLSCPDGGMHLLFGLRDGVLEPPSRDLALVQLIQLTSRSTAIGVSRWPFRWLTCPFVSGRYNQSRMHTGIERAPNTKAALMFILSNMGGVA